MKRIKDKLEEDIKRWIKSFGMPITLKKGVGITAITVFAIITMLIFDGYNPKNAIGKTIENERIQTLNADNEEVSSHPEVAIMSIMSSEADIEVMKLNQTNDIDLKEAQAEQLKETQMEMPIDARVTMASETNKPLEETNSLNALVADDKGEDKAQEDVKPLSKVEKVEKVNKSEEVAKDAKSPEPQSSPTEAPKTKSANSRGGKSSAFVYNSKVPMPREHQQFLYDMCKKRNIDYREALAVIQHESEFNSEAISKTKDYGYFQVNRINHKNLSNILDTLNKPLDPYVNINWGTYMLSDLYERFSSKGYTGAKLKEAVLSSYNKGENGYRKHGKAVSYIKNHNEARKIVDSYFN